MRSDLTVRRANAASYSIAPKTAHQYLQHLVRQADEACERLQDPDDAEALHDFRVAVRRSRSWLKAFNDHIGIEKDAMLRLRTLARRTNGPRDAEIALIWLQRLGEGLKVAKLVEEFKQRCNATLAEIRGLIAVEWPELSAKLSLEPKGLSDDTPFASIAMKQAKVAHGRLAVCLGQVHSLADIEAAHRARIASKRLRYLLEPFRHVAGEIDEAAELLKQVQDDLGDLHDLHLLLESLPNGKKVRALTDRINTGKQELFKAIHRRCLGTGKNDFLKQLDDAITQLDVV